MARTKKSELRFSNEVLQKVNKDVQKNLKIRNELNKQIKELQKSQKNIMKNIGKLMKRR